jgi:putative RecB family exonuclease
MNIFNALTNGFKRWSHSRREIELSYSRIQTYLRCPYLYHLVYHKGWRAGPTGSMALGMSLHRALALYLAPDNHERTMERLGEIYDQVWVNEGFSSTQETLDCYDKGRHMLEEFYRTDSERQVEVVATEKDFEIKFDAKTRLRGTMDRLDRYADGTHEIVEYKTHAEHWTESRVGNDLQMTLYALAMRENLGPGPLKLRYHFLSTGESLYTQRTGDQIDAARKIVSDVAAHLRKEEFSANPSFCMRCEFKKRCDKGTCGHNRKTEQQ